MAALKRALAIDLDGTLLDRTRSISPHSLRMIEEVLNRGWVVILATARPVRAIALAVPDWFRRFYWAACNGAWILKDGEILKRTEIPYASTIPLIRSLTELDLPVFVEAEDRLFSNHPMPDGFLGDCESLDRLGSGGVCKVIVHTRSHEEVRTVADLVPAECACVVTDGDRLVQIAHRECSKLDAVRFVLSREGVRLRDTIAFGDDNNDISLLGAVGCGVAMGNATAALKAVAHHITLSNDRDGVGTFLEGLLSDER